MSPHEKLTPGKDEKELANQVVDGMQVFEQLVIYNEGLEAYLFRIDKGYWSKKPLDKNSEFQGGIKHYGMCYTNNFRVYLTGGL